MQTSTVLTTKPNWPQVASFLGLAFGLTWLVDLALYLNGGLANPATTLLLQFQMLLPAFSAMFLGAFFFKESPIYFKTNRRTSRWFVYFYLLLTFLYLLGAIAALVQPNLAATLTSALLIPNVLGLILIILLRLVGGKDSFAGAGLGGGKGRVWLFYGLGLVAFYGIQTLLNYIFKMGQVVDITTAFPQMATANLPAAALVPIMALNTVLIGPFLGLIIAFGEEYGWRGYLQTELTRLGRVRGVFLLGVIWGIWHWPVIWMGYNFPGQPVLGSLAMVALGIVFAYFFAYSVFKSQGVWTAAYLHALNNQALSFFFMFVYAPTNILFSFGAGWPGLALGALVVFFILRDPIWKVTE
ncbi:MAG: CPBP family intramembrane metalloprotease [Anaerolineales bacterium]|nr:CPBP family intramembrane metalloprotease [Anaerolineales bacterium]